MKKKVTTVSESETDQVTMYHNNQHVRQLLLLVVIGGDVRIKN